MKFPTGQGYYYSQNTSICIYSCSIAYAILNNKVFSGKSKEFISYTPKRLEKDGKISDSKAY